MITLHSGAGRATEAPTLLDSLGTHPTVVCSEIREIERGKFRDCRLRWLTQDLATYATTVERLRLERIERERNKAWAWLANKPIQDCTTVPELEIAKFPLCSGAESGGNSLLATHENGLAELRASRDQFANDLANLKTRLERLRARSRETQQSLAGPSADELQPLMERLIDLDTQSRLLEAMVNASPSEPVVAYYMTRAPGPADLLESASATATVIAAIQEGDRLVRIETTQTDSEFIPVVHAQSGFGYVARTDLGQ